MRAPARFLCITEQNSFPEIGEVPHSVAYSFQNLGLVVAALYKAVCPGDVHGVETEDFACSTFFAAYWPLLLSFFN